MSDNITEFKLRHIVVAVRDVITEWHELGLHLGLPEPDLKLIASNPDIEGRLRMMLSKWLGYDPEASWDKLANVLNTMGKNAIAANIRSKYVGTVDAGKVSASDQEDTKARKYMYTSYSATDADVAIDYKFTVLWYCCSYAKR